MNALLLAHLGLLFGGTMNASDDGEHGAGSGGALKVSVKRVAAHKLLEHGVEVGKYDLALAMREPAAGYRSVVDDLQGAVKRSLKKNSLVDHVKVLKAFPADVEPSEIADTIEERDVRYLVLITIDPSEGGDDPMLLLELWNAKGKVKERLEIEGALSWKEADEEGGREAPKGNFDRDAWKLAYERHTSWTYTRGGYLPSTTSTAVVVDTDNNVLDDHDIEAGASPEVTQKAAVARRLGTTAMVFQLASWAVILGFPACLGCLGAVGGLGVGAVAAVGQGVSSIAGGLVIGLLGGCLSGCVISFVALWPINLGQYVLNLVAYYFRKAFYYSAINEHNQTLSEDSNLSLEDQPREYHPSSLFWD